MNEPQLEYCIIYILLSEKKNKSFSMGILLTAQNHFGYCAYSAISETLEYGVL